MVSTYEINNFIKKWCIEFIKSDCKKYLIQKIFILKKLCSIYQRILKQKYHSFYDNIRQYKCLQHW